MTDTTELTLLERVQSPDQEDWPLFSYSQLQVWDRCEFQWYWNYDQGWASQSKSSALEIGSIIHDLLEIHYLELMLGNRDTIPVVMEAIKKLTAEAMQNGLNTASLEEVSRAGKIVIRYLREYAPLADNNFQIMGVEYHFRVPIKTPKGYHIVLQGYLDLVYSLLGKIYIMDHKSTSDAKFWKPDEVLMDPQMTLYQFALRQMGIPVHGIVYNFLNTYDYKKGQNDLTKLFKRDPTYRTENEITNFARQLLNQVDSLIEAVVDPNHLYQRSLRRDCDRCQFKNPCLFSLKGIDPQPILITKFKQKEKPEIPELVELKGL